MKESVEVANGNVSRKFERMFNFLIILRYFDTLVRFGTFLGWGVTAGCILVVGKPGIQRNGEDNYVEIFQKN